MNTKTSRSQKKEQTKALLISTAYEIFSERGIQAVRMSDIASSANVSHGTVFLHFNTQEALITEVVQYYCRKIAVCTHELSEGCHTLRDLLTAHLEAISKYELFYKRLVIESRMLPIEARDAFITVQSAISLHFSMVLEKEDVPSLPASILFNMWMGLVHYYLMNDDLFAPQGQVIARYKTILTDTFLSLLEKESRPRITN